MSEVTRVEIVSVPEAYGWICPKCQTVWNPDTCRCWNCPSILKEPGENQ